MCVRIFRYIISSYHITLHLEDFPRSFVQSPFSESLNHGKLQGSYSTLDGEQFHLRLGGLEIPTIQWFGATYTFIILLDSIVISKIRSVVVVFSQKR